MIPRVSIFLDKVVKTNGGFQFEKKLGLAKNGRDLRGEKGDSPSKGVN